MERHTSRRTFANAGASSLGGSSKRTESKSHKKGGNMMMDMMMAMMMQEDQRERATKREQITKALEMQDVMLKGLQRDMGEIEKPEEEEMAQKVMGIAKFISTEKKIREKRQRQEMQRSQDMLNTLLQYSILMSNGGGLGSSADFSKMDPSQPFPPLSSLAQSSMVNILNNTPLDLPGMPTDQFGLMSNINEMSQDVIGETEDMIQARKDRKRDMKRMRELRHKRLYERRKKEKIEATKREIAEREAENRRLYEEMQRNLVNNVIDQNRDDFEDKLRLKREAEEERKRRELAEKEAREQKIRDWENRIEYLWTYFKALVLYHMAPFIIFTDVKTKVMQTKPTNIKQQIAHLEFSKKLLIVSKCFPN